MWLDCSHPSQKHSGFVWLVFKGGDAKVGGDAKGWLQISLYMFFCTSDCIALGELCPGFHHYFGF